MALVVGLHGLDRGGGLIDVPKAQQPFRFGEEAARTGVLDHSGLGAREVADRAVADPGVGEQAAGRLRAAELGPRALDVRAVVIRRCARLPGVPHGPAGPLQERDIRVGRVVVECERHLERLVGPRGQLRVFEEGDPLVVAHGLVVELDPTLPPVRDRRVRARGRFGGRPGGQEDRRMRVVPADTAVREAGLGPAHRFPDREVEVVLEHAELGLAHPELQKAGIEVNEGRSPEHRERPRGSVVGEVEHDVGLRRGDV